jgi:FkbM family methyltransferase
MSIDLEKFDWGKSNEWFVRTIKEEFFNSDKNVYETVFEVEENDVVMDIGASIGPWSYQLKDRNVEHLYVIEPSKTQSITLLKNIDGIPYTYIPNVISDNDLVIAESFGDSANHEIVKAKTFMQIIEENNIEKIDFLKTDCEGGEYEVFKVENICWLKENMKKCAGEWHLNSPKSKKQFREFRDVFLRIFPNHKVYSVDGIDIKWDLWNEHFIEFYNEVIIHIDNR